MAIALINSRKKKEKTTKYIYADKHAWLSNDSHSLSLTRSPFIFVIVNIELISNEFVFLLQMPCAKWTILSNQIYVYIYTYIHTIHVDECSVFISSSSSFWSFFLFILSFRSFVSWVVIFLFLTFFIFHFLSQKCVHFIYSLIYICLHPFYFEC